MRSAKLFLVLVLFFFIIPSYSSANTDELTVQVEGNTKTLGIYIEALLKKCLRRMSTDEPDPETYLSQCIYNAKHFSKVVVKKNNNSFHINVEEKWSLIPIPIVAAGSGGEEKYGLVLLDSNFLGLGKIFAIGGSIGSSGNTYFFHFDDKKVFLSNWSFLASHSRSNRDYYLYDGTEKVFGFHENRLAAVLGLGYQFKNFSPALRYVLQINEYENLLTYQKPKDYRVSKAGIRLRYDYSDYKLYYNSGVIFDASILRDLSRSDDHRFSTLGSSKVRIGVPSILGHAVLGEVQGGRLTGGSDTDIFRLGLTKGFRGIPALGAWPESYIAASFDYQVPIRSLSIGTWTIAPFADAGHLQYRNDSASELSYQSYGIGTYIFLKEIAIPGLGIEIGRNTTFQDYFANFSLGLQI